MGVVSDHGLGLKSGPANALDYRKKSSTHLIFTSPEGDRIPKHTPTKESPRERLKRTKFLEVCGAVV